MDRQTESSCLGLLENYRTLAAGNRMEFTEMVLACAGIYLAAGASPDLDRLKACKTLLKSKAGIFSNFRRSPPTPRSILKTWRESIAASRASSAESRRFSPP